MTAQPRLLITGATGFVGRAVVDACVEQGLVWTGQTRGNESANLFRADFLDPFDWTDKLRGGTIVHLAGMAHASVADGRTKRKMHRINVAATAELARQAVEGGAAHFIFVSSIHSYLYEHSLPGASYYGYSKKMAEEAILAEAAGRGMAVTILRPPLMFGKGVKGNLASMMKWVKRGLPLPLQSVKNKRSFMHVRNFADIILRCAGMREKAQGIFEVADGSDYSTPELLLKVANALGKSPRIFPFPPSLLRLGAAILGKAEMAEKLLGDMTIDGTKLLGILNWRRKYTDSEGFKEMVDRAPLPNPPDSRDRSRTAW